MGRVVNQIGHYEDSLKLIRDVKQFRADRKYTRDYAYSLYEEGKVLSNIGQAEEAAALFEELARRRESYEMAAKRVLMAGEINSDDRRQLAEKREQLGLAAEDAKQLLKKAALDSAVTTRGEVRVCRHCGKPID